MVVATLCGHKVAGNDGLRMEVTSAGTRPEDQIVPR
jgi:hypothetical protein